MLDVDRRAFVAGMSVSTLPVSAGTNTLSNIPVSDIGRLLGERLDVSAATASAMESRALRFTGATGALLIGASDGERVVLARDSSRHGNWLMRGVAGSERVLANATAFACHRATEQLERAGMSFRWFSGCSFGGATAHLFRGNKSSLFLITRATPAVVQPRRLDIVLG